MKRSAQVGLVVMGALGVTGASAYYVTRQDAACRAATPSGQQAVAPGAPGAPAVPVPPPGQPAANPQAAAKADPNPDCNRRRGWWGGRSYYGWGSGREPTRTNTQSPGFAPNSGAPRAGTPSGPVPRGGFGSSGRSVSG